jgi:hypothetical protein
MDTVSQKMPESSHGGDTGASNAPGDAGRVSGSNVQTAPIALLPVEILSEIIKLVAANGVKKQDVENTLRTCRAVYCAGLPLLFREVTLDSKTGAEKLKALAGGPTGIDKTEFVRVLKVPAGLAWTGKTKEVLKKCLANVTRFEFTAHGKKVFETIWKLLDSAPMMKELRLELHNDAFLAFDAQTVFPASVRLLSLHLQERPVRAGKHVELFTMINDRGPDLTDVVVEGAQYYRSILATMKLKDFPVLSAKIRRLTAGPRDGLYIPNAVTDLTLLFPAHWPWSKQYQEALTHLRSLEHVETLTLEGMRTSYLAHFAGLFPSVRKISIKNAIPDLSADRFAAAAAAVCRPDVEVTVRFERFYYNNNAAEKDFWRSQAGVTVVA